MDRTPAKPAESEGFMSDNGNGSNMLMGLVVGSVVGVAIGAGIALLLAPGSGKDSREWLAKRTRELKGRVGAALEQGKQAVRDGTLTS
jgi:gas vesicle protein